jgi:hypothetical protein|tara:strand:- start:1324 stop:1596 length:273 start_codon:yes stop_codon:yes gene_type:complete
MSESTATKLTTEELAQVKELQGELNNLLMNIGNAETVKSQLVGKYSGKQGEWKTMTESLEKKYGAVNISLEDGTISEVEEEIKEEEYTEV